MFADNLIITLDHTSPQRPSCSVLFHCYFTLFLPILLFYVGFWNTQRRNGASERQNKHGLWVEVRHKILLAKLLSRTQWARDWYRQWPRQWPQDIAMGIQVQLSPKVSILLRRRQDPMLNQNSRPVSVGPEALGSASIVQSLILRTSTRWFSLVFSKLWWRTGEGREKGWDSSVWSVMSYHRWERRKNQVQLSFSVRRIKYSVPWCLWRISSRTYAGTLILDVQILYIKWHSVYT